MKQSIFFLAILVFGINIQACQSPSVQQEVPKAQRIISIGGTITEIVYALGEGASVIAVDKTSTFPESTHKLTNLGYRNSIKAEGIISLAPDLVLAESGYMNTDIYQQLESTGIRFKTFPASTSVDSTISLIRQIATYLNKVEQGDSLIALLRQDIASVHDFVAQQSSQPKVLFVFARGTESVSMVGANTFAESLIRLAGGDPALSDTEGFKPLSSEALVSANPDFLLFFESGLQSVGGVEGAKKLKGVELTTAGQQGNILAFDGLLISGFGPRLGKVAMELAQKIHTPNRP